MTSHCRSSELQAQMTRLMLLPRTLPSGEHGMRHTSASLQLWSRYIHQYFLFDVVALIVTIIVVVGGVSIVKSRNQRACVILLDTQERNQAREAVASYMERNRVLLQAKQDAEVKATKLQVDGWIDGYTYARGVQPKAYQPTIGCNGRGSSDALPGYGGHHSTMGSNLRTRGRRGDDTDRQAGGVGGCADQGG